MAGSKNHAHCLRTIQTICALPLRFWLFNPPDPTRKCVQVLGPVYLPEFHVSFFRHDLRDKQSFSCELSYMNALGSIPQLHYAYRVITPPTPTMLCRLLQKPCSGNNSQIGIVGRLARIGPSL